tara:strand:+ start:166 stop:369 length:204 start_codon:yes stop_codon:yes gene_type:complete
MKVGDLVAATHGSRRYVGVVVEITQNAVFGCGRMRELAGHSVLVAYPTGERRRYKNGYRLEVISASR